MILAPARWRRLAAEHAARADALTAGHRARRAARRRHAIEDFLYDYYGTRPSVLRRWHPGVGVGLAIGPPGAGPPGAEPPGAEPPDAGPPDAGPPGAGPPGAGPPRSEPAGAEPPRSEPAGAEPPRSEPAGAEPPRSEPPPHVRWRWYSRSPDGAAVRLDVPAFLANRRESVVFIRDLLAATAARPAFTGCFGLHEWAMVYRQAEHRHPLPLRLGQAGTDAVVEAHQIRCTHFDAYRFFTPHAAPLNRERPTRAAQVDLEQPGCLHAAMDCHKWATKLGPAVPGDLALDCFALARDIRLLDMRASPYDLSAYGEAPVAIETPEGKATYVAGQRAFADRASAVRARLLAVCERLLRHE